MAYEFTTSFDLDYEAPTFDTGSDLKVKKPRARRGKTFAHQLEPLVPKKFVDPEFVPEKKLTGNHLRMYAVCAFLAALIVAPTTVLVRAHVDYLGGHRTLPVMEQIECVLTNGIAKDPNVGPWAMGFESACPIRHADHDTRR